MNGVFVFRELARFIAAGRLNCKIDKVGGVVETNRYACNIYILKRRQGYAVCSVYRASLYNV